MKFYATDISKKNEFTFEETTLRKLDYNPVNGRYLFGRYLENERLMGYEIVKPPKVKNPDGAEVFTYPATSQFGNFGWYLPVNASQDWINDLMNGVDKEKIRRTLKKC